MNLPKNYISYNQIRQYQTCPKKYYYSYIENIQTPINEHIFLGTVFHSVVEYYLNHRIAGNLLEKEAVLEQFNELFASLQEGKEVIWKTSETANRDRGLAFVRYFVKEMASSLDPLMVEKELEVDVPRVGVKLRGIIDMVEKDFSITDFKTTTSRWSSERIRGSILQMVIYKYLFEKSFGNVGSELKLIIVYSKNGANIRHQLHSMRSRDANMEKMFDIIQWVAENVSKGIFNKNESYACSFCDFFDICKKTIN